MPARHVWIAVACAVPAGLVSAALQNPQPQVFQSRVEVVQLEVRVRDTRQRPLRGLTAADFVVLQGGEARRIVSVDERRTPPPNRRQAAAGASAVRRDPAGARSVSVVFDRTIAPGTPVDTARRFAAELVERLNPDDTVGIVDVSSGETVGFTSDRLQLAQAIRRAARSPSALAVALPDPTAAAEISECPCGQCSLDAIGSLASLQATLPQQDRLLFFIGSFIQSIPDRGAECEPRLAPARQRMFRAAQTANLTIHAVDPSVLQSLALGAADRISGERVAAGIRSQPSAARASANQQNTLRELAEETGGQTVLNTNDPARQLANLLAEPEGTYLVAFEAAIGSASNQRLDVRVHREGASAYARRGYLPPEPEHTAPPARSTMTMATSRESTSATAVDRLMASLATYLAEYEKELTAIVAEEVSVQVAEPKSTVITATSPRTLPTFSTGRRQSRRLRSDVLIVPDATYGWVAFRDVFEVDGAPVRDRSTRIADLFLKRTPNARNLADQIVKEGARFNVELESVQVPRTINMPLTALRFLRPENRPRSQYRINVARTAAEPQDAGIALDFQEVGKPRLIRSPDDAAARGTLWVEPGSGRIRATILAIDTGRTSATIYVKYASVPKLAVWLPSIMEERYVVSGAGTIEGRAEYSNFRQFRISTDSVIKD
jgi:VWFA-related protein